jgi:hypothetical protein
LQTFGPICVLIAQVVYYGNESLTSNDEMAFWLYSFVMEEIFPVGFFSLMIEPQLLGNLFNRIFQIIDPSSYDILKEIPSIVFRRYMMSLYAEMKRLNVRISVLLYFRLLLQ